MAKVLKVRVSKVVQRTHEEAFSDLTVVSGGQQQTVSTAKTTARKEFEWDTPVQFSLAEGEQAPEELRLSVRGRLGHSGTPEVLGFGTINLREALARKQALQTIHVALTKHHKRNMEAEAVITEHTGDAEVVIELE